MKKQTVVVYVVLSLVIATVVLGYGRINAKEYVYISPRPNASYVPTETTIVINYGEPLESQSLAGKIVVRGEKSGTHTGQITIANDNQTAIFTPDASFYPGEVVHVMTLPNIKGANGRPLASNDFTFTTSPKQNEDPFRAATQEIRFQELVSERQPLTSQGVFTNTVTDGLLTLPSDFPPITTTVSANNTDDGYIFLSNFSINWNNAGFAESRPYLLILDNSGQPVFYRRLPQILPAIDFKKQPNGLLTYALWGDKFYAMDETYTIVDTYEAGNGYAIDIHELQILPNGHALLMIYDAQPVDMSAVVSGGDPDAIVIGLVIQELDTDKNVVFQWRSWDHIPITDSHVDLTAPVVDYMHGNSIDLDDDGNLLVSSRGIDEVTKINRQTGDIIWRMGSGVGNEFTFINDEPIPFEQQHDARRLENGNISIFDNRTGTGDDFARAIEYEVDELNKTAELVWEYRTEGSSPAMGNAQRLSNGNTVIGWGSLYPTLTEVMPNGDVAFELRFLPHADPSIVRNSYRAFRFPWEGAPLTPPYLVTQSLSATEVDLHFSWNGATDVALYKILAGNDYNALTEIGTMTKNSFETTYSVTDADNYCFFQVVPVLNDMSIGLPSNRVIAEHCIATQLIFPLISMN